MRQPAAPRQYPRIEADYIVVVNGVEHLFSADYEIGEIAAIFATTEFTIRVAQ